MFHVKSGIVKVSCLAGASVTPRECRHIGQLGFSVDQRVRQAMWKECLHDSVQWPVAADTGS